MRVNLEKLMLIAQLNYPTQTRVWLTTTNWGMIAAEINQTYRAELQTKGGMANAKNFKDLRFLSTTFINSGTDDQDVCNILNAPEEAKSPFRYKEANFAVRAR